MNLISTWRRDITKLWTVRLALAQAIIAAAQSAAALYQNTNPWPALAVFAGGVLIAAARLVQQKDVGTPDAGA